MREKIILIFILLTVSLSAQKVIVSRDINIKNNFTYDILPNIGENNIFYHDKGSEQVFEIFDQNLNFKGEVIPQFETRSIRPLAAVPYQDNIYYYYAFREGSDIITRAIKFNSNIAIQDSATISITDRKISSNSPRYVVSDDKSRVLLFTPVDKDIRLQLIDNGKLSQIYDYTVSLEEINFKTGFERITVNNAGEIFIIVRKISSWGREKSKGFKLVKISSNQSVTVYDFTPERDAVTFLKLDYDELNKKIAIGGFVSAHGENTATGYFGFSIRPNQIPTDAEIIINRFTADFLYEALGRSSKKNKELRDYRLKDMILRKDGGVILIAEYIREFARRSHLAAPGFYGNNMMVGGYLDYYYEDIMILSTFPDGSEHWKKILFKKQFSQDDDAIYSSYFLFKTPSRLKLLYNDEIKSNNTVSAYILDPLGNYERQSVLSTEYQNLKLRFRDAIQVGPSRLLIPSEKSSKINLVLIDYDSDL